MIGISCDELAPIMRVIAYLINLFKWFIPIVLIVLIVFDFVKATIANDEKKMNDAKNTVGKRILYALVIFLVPTIVSLIFKTLGGNIGGDLSSPTEWISCFNRFI